jgi:hypothetical protein
MFLFIIHINVIHAGKNQFQTFSFILKNRFYRFYCDSSSNLDEHNRTHTPNILSKSASIEENPLPLPTVTKSSESLNGTNSEKSTPSSKTKVHRCRQCSFVSSVKV